MIEWLLVILNVLICGWDSFAAGLLWGATKNTFQKFIAGCALTIGVVGMLYSFVLVGVLTNFLSSGWLIASNVFLGAPLIAAGIVITIDGWRNAIKTKSFWGILINIWNTFAVIWDIRVWFDSVKMMNDAGGLGSLLKSDRDSKNATMFIVVAVIMTALISVGLFLKGKDIAEKKGIRYE